VVESAINATGVAAEIRGQPLINGKAAANLSNCLRSVEADFIIISCRGGVAGKASSLFAARGAFRKATPGQSREGAEDSDGYRRSDVLALSAERLLQGDAFAASTDPFGSNPALREMGSSIRKRSPPFAPNSGGPTKSAPSYATRAKQPSRTWSA
jgi:hypothetical protein